MEMIWLRLQTALKNEWKFSNYMKNCRIKKYI